MNKYYAHTAFGFYAVTAHSLDSAQRLVINKFGAAEYEIYAQQLVGFELLGEVAEPYIIAIDLETDGLDPVGGQILEISAHYLDSDLHVLDSFEGVLSFDTSTFTPLIRDMHTKNGLIDESATCGLDDFADWMRPYSHAVLLGSSVHFDREWLLEHTDLDLSHRVIDVSSMQGLYDLVGFEPAESEHRAHGDIMRSIKIAKMYLARLKGDV